MLICYIIICHSSELVLIYRIEWTGCRIDKYIFMTLPQRFQSFKPRASVYNLCARIKYYYIITSIQVKLHRWLQKHKHCEAYYFLWQVDFTGGDLCTYIIAHYLSTYNIYIFVIQINTNVVYVIIIYIF